MPPSFRPAALPRAFSVSAPPASPHDWRHARAAARQGQIGVVTLAAADRWLTDGLAGGDVGGVIRWALEQFPSRDVARRIVQAHFVPLGRTPAPAPQPRPTRWPLVVAGSFSTVFLARHGHQGPIGIQWPDQGARFDLAALYGAMLAGACCILAPRPRRARVLRLVEAFATPASEPGRRTFTLPGLARPTVPFPRPAVVLADQGRAAA